MSLGEPKAVMQVGVHTIDSSGQLGAKLGGVRAGDHNFGRWRA